ncbi:MAG: hypothetical protein HQM04_07705, partial [Magnetococcales bacterium]|nr:hypothetical protein [Magnetococcales bacterium]
KTSSHGTSIKLPCQRIEIRGEFTAYGEWYEKVLHGFCELLQESCQGASCWKDVFDRFEGVNDIPLMTIHKSKGLEFHTVLFIGLDDSSFWSIQDDREGGLQEFFVAFTRAKDRAFFTYCQNRGTRRKVDEIYQLLNQAGVTRITPGVPSLP